MKNKPVLATVSFLFLVFSIYAGVLLIMDNNTDTRSQAADTPTLSLSVDESSIPTNQNFAVTLDLDTANKPVNSIKAILKYDPKILTALSITPLNPFSSQVVDEQNIDSEDGLVELEISPGPGVPPNNVNGSVAIIVFRGNRPETTQIQLDEDSSAALLPDKESILITLNSISVSFTKP